MAQKRTLFSLLAVAATLVVAATIWMVQTHAVYGADTKATIHQNTLKVGYDGGNLTTFDFADMDFGSGHERVDQMLAFRATQTLSVTQGITPTEVYSDMIRVATRWNTAGIDALFVDQLGWDATQIFIEKTAPETAYLQPEDAVFYYIPKGKKNIGWRVMVKPDLFPEGYFAARTAYYLASGDEKTTAEEVFAPLNEEVITRLSTLPLVDMFTVETFDIFKENQPVLETWNGQWVNWATFLDDPLVTEQFFQPLADARSADYTTEGVKVMAKSVFATNFQALSINNNAITYKTPDGIATCAYTYVSSRTTKLGNISFHWNLFELAEPTDVYAQVNCDAWANIAITDFFELGDIEYWHIRYGTTEQSFDDLLKEDLTWFPTFSAADTSVEEVVGVLKNMVGVFAPLLPKPFADLEMIGAWKSASIYLEDEAMQPAYEAIAEYAPDYTPNGIKGALTLRYRTDFVALEFGTSSITYTLPMTDPVNCAYQFAGLVKSDPMAPQTLYPVLAAFESSSSSAQCQPFHYLVMEVYPVAGTAGKKSFRIRYGDATTGFEYLANSMDLAVWKPMMMEASTTAQDLANRLLALAETTASVLPPPTMLWSTQGQAWVSRATFVNEPAMQPIYEQVAAMLPFYSTEGVQSAFAKANKTSFTEMTFHPTTTVITFTTQVSPATGLANSTVITCAYQYDGMNPQNPMWQKYVAKGDSCADYAALVMTPPEKGDLTQWHVRYGATPTDNLITSPMYAAWYPTMYPKGTSTEQVVSSLSSSMGSLMQMFPPPLVAWSGGWTSAYTFLDDPVMDPIYEFMAEQRDDYATEGIETFLHLWLRTDFDSIIVAGDTITYTSRVTETTRSVACKYVYMGDQVDQWGPTTFSWSKFTLQDPDDSACASHKNVVTTPAFPMPAGFLQWTMRYGSVSLEDLIHGEQFTALRWAPTLYQAGATAEDYATDFEAGAGDIAQFMVPSPGRIWEGSWNNWCMFLDNTAMQRAFEAIAQVSGKRTAAQIKTALQQQCQSDVAGLKASGVKFTFTTSVSPTASLAAETSCDYEVAGSAIGTVGSSQVEWIKLRTTSGDSVCAPYKYVLATQIDYAGAGGVPEWHVRYGSESFEALLNDDSSMLTMYAEDTTVEQIADDVVAEAMEVEQTLSSGGVVYLPLISR